MDKNSSRCSHSEHTNATKIFNKNSQELKFIHSSSDPSPLAEGVNIFIVLRNSINCRNYYKPLFFGLVVLRFLCAKKRNLKTLHIQTFIRKSSSASVNSAGKNCCFLQEQFKSFFWCFDHGVGAAGKRSGHSTSSSSSLWKTSNCGRRETFKNDVQEQVQGHSGGVFTYVSAVLRHPGGVIFLQIASAIAQHASLGDRGQGQQAAGGLRGNDTEESNLVRNGAGGGSTPPGGGLHQLHTRRPQTFADIATPL